MMHKLHKLLRDDIHKNQMVENQTDFHTASCFLVDIQTYYYVDFFQKLYLIQVTKKLVCNFVKAVISFFVHWNSVFCESGLLMWQCNFYRL